MADEARYSSWLAIPNGAVCPADGTRLWFRQVWEPLCWWWEHMCPECRAAGTGMPSAPCGSARR